jgi:hypothetical protein
LSIIICERQSFCRVFTMPSLRSRSSSHKEFGSLLRPIAVFGRRGMLGPVVV